MPWYSSASFGGRQEAQDLSAAGLGVLALEAPIVLGDRAEEGGVVFQLRDRSCEVMSTRGIFWDASHSITRQGFATRQRYIVGAS